MGRRTADGGKSKNNMSTPQWGGHNKIKPVTEKLLSLSSDIVVHSCMMHKFLRIKDLKYV